MELMEKTVASQPIFDGAIIQVRLDTVELPNGNPAPREVVSHPGGVGVLPLHEDGTVTVVRQYRHPFGQVITEIPAGKLDPGEGHRLCGLRELEEEAGLVPEEFTYLGCLMVSPGFSDEIIHLYLARNMRSVPVHPDPDEFLELCRVPFAQLYDQVVSNQLQDGKTVAAILKTKLLLGL